VGRVICSTKLHSGSTRKQTYSNRRCRTCRYYVLAFDEFAAPIPAEKEEKKKEFEALVVRLAAKGRTADIHLVLATQRPDPNVLTGLIKANLPFKVCMRVINATNSTIILDQTGGEKLLGRGDLPCDRGKGIEWAQSPYITQEEFCELPEKSRRLPFCRAHTSLSGRP